MIEDTCKKNDQPGIYATFKYMDEDDLNQLSTIIGLKDEGNVDKGLWGMVIEEEEEEIQEDF